MKLSRLSREREPEQVKVKRVAPEAKVEVPRYKQERKYPVLGASYCPDLYGNILFAGKKMSGKTVALRTSVLKTTGPKTTYIIFSGTIHDDDTMKGLIKELRDKGRTVVTHTSTYEQREGKHTKANLVQELLSYFQERNKPEIEDVEPNNPIALAYGDAQQKPPVPKPKERQHFFVKKGGQLYEYPEFAIILDDASGDLRRNKAIIELLKVHRHAGSKIFISSQYYVDLPIDARKQMDQFLCFKGLDDKRLDYLYADALIDHHPETFAMMYRDFTSEPHSFMLIDTKRQKFRKRFDYEAEIIPPAQSKPINPKHAQA